MKQELARYLPQPPKHGCLLGSWCSGCRESQRDGWAGEGGMSSSSLDGKGKALGSRASVSRAALVVHLASRWQQALCPQLQAGDRTRHSCKWERQVPLVSRRSRLGQHMSERTAVGLVSFPSLCPHLYPQLKPGFLSSQPSLWVHSSPHDRISCVHLVWVIG